MSTLVAQTISNGTISTSTANVINGAKAWVNFNGSGGASIRASYNVSSVTRNGTGDYTVNFTNAFPDANYCVTFGQDEGESDSAGFNNTFNIKFGVAPTTTSMRFISIYRNYVFWDAIYANVAIFR
jgi:hypothetical protein